MGRRVQPAAKRQQQMDHERGRERERERERESERARARRARCVKPHARARAPRSQERKIMENVKGEQEGGETSRRALKIYGRFITFPSPPPRAPPSARVAPPSTTLRRAARGGENERSRSSGRSLAHRSTRGPPVQPRSEV